MKPPKLLLSMTVAGGLLAILNADVMAAGCAGVPPGIVGWWPSEGDANNVVEPSHGLLVGNVTFVPGMVAQAFQFDGSSSLVHVVAATNLDVGPAAGLSIEGWINPADLLPHPLAQWSDPPDVSQRPTFWISVPTANGGTGPGCLLMDIPDWSQHHIVVTAPGAIQAGRWQHVAVSFDRTSGSACLFVNGALLVQTNLGAVTPATTWGFWIGHEYCLYQGDLFRSIGNGEAWYSGGIDELSLYNRALLPEEVLEIYQAGGQGKCPLPPTTAQVEPQDQSVPEAQYAALVALANGSPTLHYQWLFNGSEIPGATNGSLTFESAWLTNAGLYAVRVTNTVGSVTSSTSRLDVLPAYEPAWRETAAPTNAFLNTVACSADGTRIVASGYKGAIYTSTDFGLTWRSNEVPNLAWMALASSADGTKLVAAASAIADGTPGGVYGSTNAGATWRCYRTVSSFGVGSSADGAGLAALCADDVFVSDDFGGSWTGTAAPYEVLRWPRSLACSSDGMKLFLAAGTGALYASVNRGHSWVLAYNIFSETNLSLHSIASSADGTKLAAAALDGVPLYLSTNSGASWFKTDSPLGDWLSVASSADGNRLAAGMLDGYLYFSSDGGKSWGATRAPRADWLGLAASADGFKWIAACRFRIYTWQPMALDIKRAGALVSVTWSTNVAGFTLKRSSGVGPSGWASVTNVPTVVDRHYQVLLLPTNQVEVYRLRQQ